MSYVSVVLPSGTFASLDQRGIRVVCFDDINTPSPAVLAMGNGGTMMTALERGVNDRALTNTWLLVRLADEYYALPGAAVREVIRYRAPVPVPGAPPSLPGLLNQRGVVLTVVDLRPLLGLTAATPLRTSRYAYVQHGGADLALIVDGVIDLIEVAAEQLEPLPPNLDPLRARLLQAIAHHEGMFVALLDLDVLFQALREEL